MRRPLTRQAGMSLIELMIALVIGSILMIGAITVYTQSRANYIVNESVARLQENARFAMDFLEPDLRLASFWGQTSRSNLVEVPAPPVVMNDCAAGWAVNVFANVTGSNNVYPWACGAFNGNPQLGSDTLEVRHVGPGIAPPQAGLIQIQSNRARGGILFSNGIPPALPNSQTNNLVVSGYYVAQDSVLGVGVPSLRSQSLLFGPSIVDLEVIPGVQDLQVQFGVDRNADGTVERYVNPGDPLITFGAPGFDPNARITVARIFLLMRAERLELGFTDTNNYVFADRNLGPFNDGFRRLLVSKTITLRNARL
ncbi:MAG: PilW family protein [Gammaproteobacteria bacterium]|nr:PilW family protein [Gammaproteobacteria bacterium]